MAPFYLAAVVQNMNRNFVAKALTVEAKLSRSGALATVLAAGALSLHARPRRMARRRRQAKLGGH
jgi:hypothetical protein